SMELTSVSMTQTSIPLMFRIWLVVSIMIPQKIDICWDMSSAANVTPKTIPRNLVRSPTSIWSAVQITAASLPSGDPSPPAPRGELDPASPASGVLSSQIRTGVAGTSTGLGRHGPEGIIEQDRHETTDANFLRLFPD